MVEFVLETGSVLVRGVLIVKEGRRAFRFPGNSIWLSEGLLMWRGHCAFFTRVLKCPESSFILLNNLDIDLRLWSRVLQLRSTA